MWHILCYNSMLRCARPFATPRRERISMIPPGLDNKIISSARSLSQWGRNLESVNVGVNTV